MSWTPMLDTTFFDGVKADMLVAVGGILGPIRLFEGP